MFFAKVFGIIIALNILHIKKNKQLILNDIFLNYLFKSIFLIFFLL